MAATLPIYRNKEGKKLYPVCSWEENQHKLYNAYDRIMIHQQDAFENGCSDKEWDEIEKSVERIERALGAFDAHVIKGLVYATWEDGQIIKDYVWAYNARH